MKIVGITSFPTGIAHTYMAAEALEKAAKKLGYDIKVETQGSIGIENRITPNDVKQAEVVIFAADVAVKEERRFTGKIIYRVKAQSAIKDPKGVIESAVKLLEK